jgi:hypothetical protein
MVFEDVEDVADPLEHANMCSKAKKRAHHPQRGAKHAGGSTRACASLCTRGSATSCSVEVESVCLSLVWLSPW